MQYPQPNSVPPTQYPPPGYPQQGYPQQGYPQQQQTLDQLRPGMGRRNSDALKEFMRQKPQEQKIKGQGGGFMNSLERWTGMDWNGDGVVGGVGTLPAQKAFDWQAYERLHGVDLDGDGQIGGRAMTQDDLQGVGI
eukprot:3252594-Rhodomonas_salina.5